MVHEENYKLYPLKWDTDYFNISSARLDITNKLKEEEIEEIMKLCNNYEFITISNNENCNENNIWIGQMTNAFMVDMNIQFVKTDMKGLLKKTSNIVVENYFAENTDILNIAKSSFQYSRFFNDPYLPEEQKKSMYVEWVKSSFNQKNKYFIYCYTESNEIMGFILFNIEEEVSKAHIELIAVADEYKGNKVGSNLMKELESFLTSKNINKIYVGTQVNNVNAINFYRKNGFMYWNCRTIYHYWR